MASDYIPAPDDEFDTYASQKFVPYAGENGGALGATAADIAAMHTAFADWNTAWAAFGTAETAFRTATEEKNAKRAALEAAMRTIAGKAQADRSVTDAQKEALGITVRKTTRTPVPVPSSTPAMQRVDTSTRAILRLFIGDATTPETRAKPPGVRGCEIREQIGGTPPVDPETMAYLATETRMPYRADYEAGDVGKTVYFALRWVNTRGEPGPWSQVFTAVVPG